MKIVVIHHIRPGKAKQIFNEGLVTDNHLNLLTLTNLSTDETTPLSERLRSRGFIESDETVCSAAKYYSYGESFNLLVFRDQTEKALGYYSDIAMPIRKVEDGYEIIDLFLDIWVKPDGPLLELDMDEFQEPSQRDSLQKNNSRWHWRFLIV